MAHTETEDETPSIIPQKPPPPPLRAPQDDEKTPGDDRPVPPAEAAPRAPSSPPASRRHARKPSGHLVIPQHDIDPLIIDRAGPRPRMGSAPMMLIDYPRLNRPSLTR